MALKQDFGNIDKILNDNIDNDIFKLNSIICGYNISSWNIFGDTIFLANRCSLIDSIPHLIALDLKTLKKKWQFNYEDGEAGTGNIINNSGLLYFGGERFLHVLDMKNGNEKWKFEYPNRCERDDTIMVGRSTIDDKFLYLADYKQVYAIDLETNLIKWEFPSKNVTDFNVFPYYEQLGVPMLDDKGLYLCFENGKIYSLDCNGGKERWEYLMQDKEYKRNFLAGNFELTIECLTSPRSPVLHKEYVIFSDERNVCSLDKNNGKLAWVYPIKKNGSVKIYCKDNEVFLSDGSNIYILDAKNGKERLKIPHTKCVDFITTDGEDLYVGSNCRLNIYNKNNLEKKIEMKFDSTMCDIFIEKNELYIQTYHNLYIFNKK